MKIDRLMRASPLPPLVFMLAKVVTALVFAFLGFLTVLGEPGNLPAATGARGPRVLGHITPA